MPNFIEAIRELSTSQPRQRELIAPRRERRAKARQLSKSAQNKIR